MVFTFTSGVNTSFSSQLNSNFADARHLNTRNLASTTLSTTSASMQDGLQLTTPAATKNNQTVLIEFWGRVDYADSGNSTVELYDATDSAVIATCIELGFEDQASSQNSQLVIGMGTVTISTAGSTKSVKVRYCSDGNSSHTANFSGGYLKATLVES